MQETNDQAPVASGVRFGPFELFVEAGELRKDGVRLKLSGQPIQVLVRLVAEPGKLVSREQLQAELWPGSSYGDFEKGLNAAVNRLRENLGDSATEPKYIETVPRRGYRFIAEVIGPKGALKPGKIVSHYQIIGIIGSGGMGIVYRARDLNLGRDVALKFLPDELATNQKALARFRREASTASALNHPNICTVYEIGEADGRTFIAMEFLDGVTLKHMISFRPMNTHSVLSMGIEIASALGAVHREGIIHRDIKPGNVFVTKHGHMKIVDFGLAKETGEGASMAETIGADSDAQPLTNPGTLTGTVEYMSPEQVKDCELDARTDLFSFGAVLYEMATGKRPFGGSSLGEICGAILHDTPEPPSKLNPEVPLELDRIIGKLLQKDREERYGSAYEVRTDLSGLKQELLEPTSLPVSRLLRRPIIAIPLILTVVAVVLASAWLVRRNARIRWAREQALPQIVQLIQQDRNPEAFALAEQAETYIPNDPMLAELWPRMSRVVNIHTDPEGADVYVKPYESPDGNWQYLGKTPLQGGRIPLAFLRWKLKKEEYRDFEGTLPGEQWWSMRVTPDSPVEIKFVLTSPQSAPAGMVRVAGGNFSPEFAGMASLPEVRLQDFWIDQHEVTNLEFKKFVDAGGYTNPQYWKEPFVKDGHTVSWSEAMGLFRDKTGRPGPATWELGEHPEGEGNYPIVGVGWFEAAAYAAFVGKSLPTLYHWNRAAGTWAIPSIAPLSNFSGRSLSQVGVYAGLGPYGTYDMAGNAKEWCWNAVGNKRYILGGGWDEVV